MSVRIAILGASGAVGSTLALHILRTGVSEDVPSTMLEMQVPLIDLHMLVATDGRERSLSENDGLSSKPGLRCIQKPPITVIHEEKPS